MSTLATGMELDDDQVALVETIDAVLAKLADSAAVRASIETEAGFDAGLWETLVEQVGVTALAVPEEYDGVGASLVEAALVLERLGAALAPTPLLSSLIATSALVSSGEGAACSEWLPRIAAGEIVAVALPGLNGQILDADRAVAVITPGDPITITESAGAAWTITMDQTLRLGSLTAGSNPAGGAADAGRRTALIGIAALATGTAQRGLDMTVAYSKERVQFGRTIGSYQALKHRMADMLVLVETARSASWAAARGLMDAADAADYCTEALSTIAAETVQLHGGIAITWEHDAHLVFKRAHSLRQLARALA